MIDHDLRLAILSLNERGLGVRAIARATRVSRNTVRAVLAAGRPSVPKIERSETCEPHIDLIRELHQSCQGNFVRVHEELSAQEIDVSYSTLTSFCRRHGIGVTPKKPAGRYHFKPGEEMQHDTSPHRVEVGGKKRLLQCASLVLCYSRMIYAQCYPTFNRFWARSFLSDAIVFFGGAAGRCMVDNTAVVVVGGSGANAVFASELETLGEHFGFIFAAHELGDTNRSARVERPFDYIERNFYPGRTFSDLKDLNAQCRLWCETKNSAFKRSLQAKPIELFAAEKTALKPLPAYIPEVYDLVYRIVDIEGYITVHTNRYSVPVALLSRRLAIRISKDRVRIFDGHDLVADHDRVDDGARTRRTLEAHFHARRKRRHQEVPELPEERMLRQASPEVAKLVTVLRKKHAGRVVRHIKRLHRMVVDYPSEPLYAAISDAMHYGLTDLKRIEKMVLQRIAGDYFKLDISPDNEDEHGR